MEAEKRKISRAESNISGQADYQNRSIAGEIRNFSLTGFLFAANEDIDISAGEKITVIIHMTDGELEIQSTVNCVVVRNVRNVLGLKFDAIDYDTLMRLKEKLIDSIGDENRINHEFTDFLEG